VREDVASAFLIAAERCSAARVCVDLEWDLREHLRRDDLVAGALTALYPRLAGGGGAPAPVYAPWYDLLRFQNNSGRKKLRRAPVADVLVTELFGPLADPIRPEGFESLYRVVARYSITADGIELQVLAPDSPEGLLDCWCDTLRDRLRPL